jgi:lysophospholipase L1-like esterase
MMSRSGRLVKIAMLSLPALVAAALVAAAATEVYVRVTWDPLRGTPGLFLADPVTGQRLAAGYTGWFAGVPVRINNLGFRDPRDYDLRKRPNTFRILVLGDSVTFGHGSVYEHTYPYLLEQRLRAWRHNVEWHVWNAAVPGHNTSQQLALLEDVGPRFQPDLVVVGFFENDLIGNQTRRPGVVAVAARRVARVLQRHLYSFDLYRKAYLQLAWRLSGSDATRQRLAHIATEEALLSDVRRVKDLPQQRLTPFDRLSREEVAASRCVYGQTPNPAQIDALMHDPETNRWVEGVRRFQRLHREGRYRIVFFMNVAPDICQDGDLFYDGGASLMNAYFLRVLSAGGTPAVSTYEAFLHTRPSQMPLARGHAIGNANVMKADVLFEYLRDAVLPVVIPGLRVRRNP